ncbi:BAR/IMD domain-containing adapter protein 2-like 2 isoform X2 [Paralichthys olivaceus]|uniref:BAR/IMD domain-containing adapter protein 2-like 2 isoform X2 n=1 Tax=Paralichthys olivaceus TaxID=8255 RepID=UPI003753593E
MSSTQACRNWFHWETATPELSRLWRKQARPTSERCQRSERRLSKPRPRAPSEMSCFRSLRAKEESRWSWMESSAGSVWRFCRRWTTTRNHYEMEVHNLRRGNYRDCSVYMQFLRDSHEEALKEEERRYRFLAEKHCGMIQSIAQFVNKIGRSLQQRADIWTEEVNATRQPEARRPAAVENTVRQEEVRRSREEQPLGKIPSRAPSPQGSIYRSAADSVGGGAAGERSTRALVSHQPAGAHHTLLPFTRGEIITVMVQQSRNGWLYGRSDSSSRQGWFPASFVEPVDDPPKSTSSRNSTLRGSSSSSSLYDQWGSSSQSGAAPPPAPPPPPPLSLSSNRHSDMQPITPTTPTPNRQDESNNRRSQPHASQPELFPRGTNPFATVKLRPTTTNDKSSPRLERR